jgi:hypothetical protein
MKKKTKIPTGVYFDINMDNFYAVNGHGGCGEEFYRKWQDRASEFPKSSTEARADMKAIKKAHPPKIRPGVLYEKDIPGAKRELHFAGSAGLEVLVYLPKMTEEQALQLLWKNFTNNDPEIKLDDYWRDVFRERNGWALQAVLEAANGSD